MDANGVNSGTQQRPLSNGKVIYETAANLETTEGIQAIKLATFDANLAQRANSLNGQRCSFRFNVEQKGQYTNYYLNDIAPEGQLPVDSGIPTAQSAGGKSGGQGRSGGGGYKRSPEETASIVKQNVLGTAHNFIASLYQGLGPDFLEEAKARAKEYAAELFEIAKPKPAAPANGATPLAAPVSPATALAPAAAPAPAPVPAETAPIIPAPGTTPQTLAAAVPGVVVGAPSAAPAASAAEIAWT
jgi:hypothetical protein